MKYVLLFLSFFFVFTLPAARIENLERHEKKVFSQNGEDGVLERIFDLIGSGSKYYVEFGTENGHECNVRYLREYHGWKGLMMDGGHHNPAIGLYQERITAENIVSLLQKYGVPQGFDLLSIDIDSNDFYVWKALLESYRPRVVVIEYNGLHPPDQDKVIVYHPDNVWDFTDYFGASILALYNLGRKFGYSLIYAENRGVNLFFIRDDVLQFHKVQFINQNRVAKIYKPPRNVGPAQGGLNYPDPRHRPYISSAELLK